MYFEFRSFFFCVMQRIIFLSLFHIIQAGYKLIRPDSILEISSTSFFSISFASGAISLDLTLRTNCGNAVRNRPINGIWMRYSWPSMRDDIIYGALSIASPIVFIDLRHPVPFLSSGKTSISCWHLSWPACVPRDYLLNFIQSKITKFAQSPHILYKIPYY